MTPAKVQLGLEPDVPTVKVIAVDETSSTTALPVPLLVRPLMVWFWPDRSKVAVFGEAGFKVTIPLPAPLGMAVALPVTRSVPWLTVVFPAYVFPLLVLLNVTGPVPLLLTVTPPLPVTAPEMLMLPLPGL